MFWVCERNVSMRRFFYAPKSYVLDRKKQTDSYLLGVIQFMSTSLKFDLSIF